MDSSHRMRSWASNKRSRRVGCQARYLTVTNQRGLAIAAGCLAQAARVSLRAAFHGLRTSRLLLSHPAATTAMAAILTALAVHAAG